MTNRENALHDYCLSNSAERPIALEACRAALGRPLVTLPEERANVAAVLASNGHDGIGRVQSACAEFDAAAKADLSISDVAAGR